MDSRSPAREIQGTSQHVVLHVEMAGAKDFVQDDQEKIGHEGHENVDIQAVLTEINEQFEGRQNMSPGHPTTRTTANKHKEEPGSTITYSRKRKKRQMETTDATNLAKKTHKGKKSTEGNTSQKGRKRRRTSGKQSPLMIANEAYKIGTDEKCQIKVGATFVQVNEAWGILKERHRRDVKTAGFGSIEGCKIKGSFNRNLTSYIYKNMDTNMMTISFGGGDAHKEIKITKEGIHKVFGYRNGEKRTAPRPMNCKESMKVLQSELGFRNTEFAHSDLIKKLKLLVEIDREEENKKAVKILFLIFSNKVVCGTTFPRYNRQAVMLKDMNYEDMAQMDFCQVIVETI
ncbi:cell number regulator 6 [Hordeum vulgare]|nr:cell number regulator 6 [Hordeum vulgare]